MSGGAPGVIEVLCPGCKKRFKVSEKFAGKKGPCPSCKTVITIPEKNAEVVVHAPEQFGPKGTGGQAVLKPIVRAETKFSVWIAVTVGVTVLAVFITALVLRFTYAGDDVPTWILVAGAIVLAPALAWAGYTFLRDHELEPHRGTSLLIRTAICGAIYALLWLVYWAVPELLLDISIRELQPFHLLFLIPPIVVLGGVAGFACYDLDFGSGLMHYALYLIATILLCFIVDVQLFTYGDLFG